MQGDFAALGEVQPRVFLLRHAGADDEAAGEFEFEAQKDAEEVGVAQDREVAVGGEVVGNLHGVGTEANAEALAVGDAVRGELQSAVARDAFAHLAVEDVHHADEARDELAGRLLIHLARRADLCEPALVEDDDAVADFHRLFLVVRDEDGRDVQFVVEVDEHLAQLLADFRVHGGERFVEQEHVRLGRERAGEGDALALAAGKLVGEAVFQILQAEQINQLGHACDAVGLRPLLDFEAEGDVVRHAHALEERVALEDEADVALLHRHVVDALAAHENLAIGRRFKAGNHAQHGGLAATGRAEQRDELAVGDGEAHVVDGGDAAELLGDVLKLDAHGRVSFQPSAISFWLFVAGARSEFGDEGGKHSFHLDQIVQDSAIRVL